MMTFMKTELNLKDWIKVRGSADGSQSFLTWSGSIYGIVPGEPTKHLFQILGMSVARFISNPDETWDFTSREISLYLDPMTGTLLNHWQNPWTGEILPVVHVANNPVQANFNLTKRFPGIVAGNLTTFLINLFPQYPNPLAKNAKFAPYSPQAIYQSTELFKLTVSTADIENTELISIPNLMLAWDRIGPWLPWMKMGDRPGYLIYSAWGEKVPIFNNLPQLLQDEITTRVPLYQNAPMKKLAKDNCTSWNYFDRHFDAYLRQEIFPIFEIESPE